MNDTTPRPPSSSSRAASALSPVKRGPKLTEFDPCISSGELPVRFHLRLVTALSSGGDMPNQVGRLADQLDEGLVQTEHRPFALLRTLGQEP